MWERWLVWQATQDGGEGNGDGAAQDDAPETRTDAKTFSQDEVNAIVERRLQKEREKAQQQAQRERDEKEARTLAEQQQYQELSAKLTSQLETTAGERDRLNNELETARAKAARYAEVLAAQVAVQRKALPDHFYSLLDRLDPLEQLQWLSENADKLRPTVTLPQTPRPDRQGAAAVNQEEARKSQARVYGNF